MAREESSEDMSLPKQDEADQALEKEDSKRKKKKKKKKHGCLWWLILLPIRLMLLVILVGGIAGGIVGYKYYPTVKSYWEEAQAIVEKSSAEDFRMNESSYIYDSDGEVLAKLRSGGDSAYLTYDEIPRAVIDCFVAIEDNSFWDNPGFDWKGIARVAYYYIKTKGEEKHGASTITQQLARTVYLTQEKSLERKAKEIMVSYLLTQKYSKEEIMEFYINDIYFANGYYGIEAAAKGYFGKSTGELTLSQIAYLCAIPNRPSYYDPFENAENALTRRDKILKDMLKLASDPELQTKSGIESIDQASYDEAVAETITVTRTNYDMHNYEATYAINCAVRALMKHDGFEFVYHFDTAEDYDSYQELYAEAYEEAKSKLYTGGYKVYTSIDTDMQEILQTAVDENLAFDSETSEDGIYAFQGAATVIDNATSKVVAIVGGRSQEENGTYSLNRAFQSFRQPGSTIKPLVVYTPALQIGYLPNSYLQEINVSEAKKAKKKSVVSAMTGQKMTLRVAVEKSKNGCAYYLFNKIGIKYGLSFVEDMHFTKIVSNDYTLSAALGGLHYGTTTAQMASAYATLANYGTYHEETCITSILNGDEEEMYTEYTDQIYDADSSKQMLDILAGVMTNGTGKVLNWKSGVEAVGKTGTTNGSKDGWFCGATPYYTISVWCGYDTPRTLDSLYGGSYPGRIWKQAMSAYVEGKEDASFEEPENQAGMTEYLYWLSGSTLLSPGYTVNNYRQDFTIVDQVTYLTVKMKALDKNSEFWEENLNAMHDQAQEMIETIYGTKATKQAQQTLDDAYLEITGHAYVLDEEDDAIKPAEGDDSN